MTSSKLPFFFIHGAGGTKSKWRTLDSIRDISRFIDLPGHGENDAPPYERIEDYAQHLSDEITFDTIVVGHSMGGLIALELAGISDKVKGVVLVNSSYKLPVHPKIIQTLAEGTFPENLFRASYAKAANSELLEKEKEELSINPTEVTKKDFVACDYYKGGEDRLKEIDVPILLVIGDEDRLIPPETSEVLPKLNANVEVVSVKNAGHYVALEQPEAFIEEIVKFRNKLLENH